MMGARLSLRPSMFCLALLVVMGATGCSRSFYRHQADDEVYNLLGHVADDPRWSLDHEYSIQVSPESRFYDDTCPDHPPMPPDDPTAHKLMHCVDCIPGYPCWHQNGDIPTVENVDWRYYLPVQSNGELVLDRAGAVELALVQSRSYQSALESLYLSALDVTFERFRFDAQFFGGNATFYTADGRLRSGVGAAQSTLQTDTDLQVRKLYASGGEMVVGFANSLVWQFSGDNTYAANSLLNFNLIQPLLRAGGRPVVLERLTRSERALLANVRQMERFRQGFYLEVVTGRSGPSGPSRLGGFLGGAGLEGFSGVGGGGFGRVGGFGGGGGGGGAGAGQAGGYIGLLQNQLVIRNQEGNVTGLRDSLAQLEASYDAGRIDRFQVDLARQALYNAQSVLLSRKAGYQTSLDSYKVNLGLPPDLPIEIEDRFLQQFDLIDPQLTQLQQEVTTLLDRLRNVGGAPSMEAFEAMLEELGSLRRRSAAHVAIVERDVEKLDANLDTRRRDLRMLAGATELQGDGSNQTAYSIDDLNARVSELHRDFADFLQRFDRTSAEVEQLAGQAPSLRQVVDTATELSAQLTELSLVQARARIDTVTLSPIALSDEEALEIARKNRLDWMNARASVVDSWRLIEFNANALESELNVIVSGDVGTVGHNPVAFRNTNGRLSVGVEFDAPLTRLAERNQYRQSLIEYQQARRGYMQYVDQVYQGLRITLRTIQLNQLNFELRRAAVLVAINQVNLTRLRLTEPPRPGEALEFSSTTARDLVDALGQLLSVQNEFLSVWVDYEVQRMGLDFDLGTMQLDHHGLWIDPGEIVGQGPRSEIRDLISPPREPVEMDESDLYFDEYFPWEELPPPDPAARNEWDGDVEPDPLSEWDERPLPGERSTSHEAWVEPAELPAGRREPGTRPKTTQWARNSHRGRRFRPRASA